MFTPIYLLPQYDLGKLSRYQERWNDDIGDELRKKILSMIREGAGEDFLQDDFDRGELGFLENMWDLKGLVVVNEKITFPEKDNFEAIDFSYAEFMGSTFRNAVFLSCSFGFADFRNCEFIDCIFHLNGFFGSVLEKVKFVRCDFLEQGSFTNCAFSQIEFQDCFIRNTLFSDCRFDEQVEIGELRQRPKSLRGRALNNEALADIYKDMKEAYDSGGVVTKSREYFFKQMQSVTRHNSKRFREKAGGYLFELIAGYGIRPLRVLLTMLTLFLVTMFFFSLKLPFSDSLLLTAGALFTFGANAHLLAELSLFYKLVYVLTAFFGISLVALFVTVLANLWLRER